MAIIDKKQTRWYSKSTFDSLDKTTIPIGTEIQVTGELGQADFDSDTNTKLNAVPNKLDKPSGNPTKDSLVKVASTGSVEYVTYKKYYKHEISIVGSSTPASYYIYTILSDSAKINTLELLYNYNNILGGANVWLDDTENNKYYNAILTYLEHVDSKYYLNISSHNGYENIDITSFSVNDVVKEL